MVDRTSCITIFNMNGILGEKTPHLQVDSSSKFRIRGGQHIRTGPPIFLRDALLAIFSCVKSPFFMRDSVN